MPAGWKVVLIGGELTVLAAFTGLGIHLAMQPHRVGLQAPPSLLLPSAPPAAVRASAAAGPSPAASPSPRPSLAGPVLSPGWVGQLGQNDRRLASSQWRMLEGLIAGIERYLRERVVPDMERPH